MFCPHKNSYLQLPCSAEPRVINKSVRRAMRKTQFDPHDELPPTNRLESMQPSLYGPCVDVTRAVLGFGRVGLRAINRDLHSDNSLLKLQAIHSLLDQVTISENATFLISLNVVYRVIYLMNDRDPIIREKVLLILKILSSYVQGKNRIIASPVFVDRLIFMFMRDRKEIRYAAARLLKTLTRCRTACEVIMKNDNIIESLVKMLKNDHSGILIYHLNSLSSLAEWDPVKPLKANAFQVTKSLMIYHQYRIVKAAMDCMMQLCKHEVGKMLADKYDMTKFLQSYLVSPDIDVIISALGLMSYTTLTNESKWRVKEFSYDLTSRLVNLCVSYKRPALQMRAMQVLINLCACPNIRAYVKKNYEKKINKNIAIRTNEQWDGTKETKSLGMDTGHYYRTVYIENVETIKNDEGDNANALNVQYYLSTVQQVKARLIKAINLTPDV